MSAPHRHKWQSSSTQQGRMPEGAQRLCSICRVVQVKKSGRWIPLPADNATATSPNTYIVCNADGVQVSEYDNRTHAIEACEDFARAAADGGDISNGYYIHDDADYPGAMAKDFTDDNATEVTPMKARRTAPHMEYRWNVRGIREDGSTVLYPVGEIKRAARESALRILNTNGIHTCIVVDGYEELDPKDDDVFLGPASPFIYRGDVLAFMPAEIVGAFFRTAADNAPTPSAIELDDPCDCGTVFGPRGGYVLHAIGSHPDCTGMDDDNEITADQPDAETAREQSAQVAALRAGADALRDRMRQEKARWDRMQNRPAGTHAQETMTAALREAYRLEAQYHELDRMATKLEALTNPTGGSQYADSDPGDCHHRPIGEAFNDPRVPCCGRDAADCDCPKPWADQPDATRDACAAQWIRDAYVPNHITATDAQCLTIEALVNAEMDGAIGAVDCHVGTRGDSIVVVIGEASPAPNPVVRVFAGGDSYEITTPGDWDYWLPKLREQYAPDIVTVREEDSVYVIAPGGTYERFEVGRN